MCLELYITLSVVVIVFFVFKDTATTEIYTYHTLSLHDALPISPPTAAPPPYAQLPGFYSVYLYQRWLGSQRDLSAPWAWQETHGGAVRPGVAHQIGRAHV